MIFVIFSNGCLFGLFWLTSCHHQQFCLHTYLILFWSSWLHILVSLLAMAHFCQFILPLHSCLPLCNCPIVLGYSVLVFVLFCFVFNLCFLCFQFSRILLVCPLAQKFLSHVQSASQPIKGIVHFCYCIFYFQHFLLIFFLRVSISLLMLPICSCTLSIFFH